MMNTYWSRFKPAALPIGLLVAAAAAGTWLSPAERTMGYGIRPVYVHVALIWTGMAGLTVATLAGLALAGTGKAIWGQWLQTIGWVTLGFLAASFLASLVAQEVNWNGIFWDEPRSQAAGRAIAVWAVVMIAGGWLHWLRLRGLAAAIVAPLLIASMHFSQLVLHPSDPITTADSWGIQATFLGLGALSLALGVLLTWVFRPAGNASPQGAAVRTNEESSQSA